MQLRPTALLVLIGRCCTIAASLIVVAAPSLAQAQAADTARGAAEWVIEQGGSVGCRVERGQVFVRQGVPFPNGEFTINRVMLNRANLTDDDLRRLKPLDDLEYLSLVGSAISDAGLVHLAGFDQLGSLTLNATKITGAGMIHLTKVKKLRSLQSINTRITDDGLKSLAGCPHLTQINVSETDVTDKGIEHLRTLRYLSELKLNGTAVTDACLPSLERFEVLTSLSVDKCAITDAGVPALAKLKRLRTLNVRETKLSAAGLEALKKASPQLVINAKGKGDTLLAGADPPRPGAVAVPGRTSAPTLKVTTNSFVRVEPIDQVFEAPLPKFLEGATVHGHTGYTPGADPNDGFVDIEVGNETALYLAVTYIGGTNEPGPAPTTYNRLLRDGWVDVGNLRTHPSDPVRDLLWKKVAAGEKFRLRTSRHFMPLVIEPKQASSNPLDQVPNDTMTASAAQETTRSKVRHLLQGRKFDELEALAATLRREKKYDADGEAQLEIFYDGLIARGETNAEWEDDRKLYEAWLAAKPTSPAAHYALIRYWTKYGWFERNKFERDQIPSREVFKLFNERVKESQKLLIKTSESAERDPHFYVLLIDLILYAGDKPELLDKAIASSLKFDADYLPPLAKGMRYFLPRWYGGEGDMEKYGARVATQTKERHGDAVYALVAMRGAEFDTPEVLKRHHFDWERVKRGFADLRKRFPKSFAYDNWNVKFAALMEDRTETQAAFARLDAYPKAMYKLDKELEKWRRWANTDFLAGDQLAVYETLKHPVRRLEWTIDDKHWVVFDDQAELAVFDAADGKLSSRVATYAAEPRFASVVPFGKTAVAVGADGKVRAYKIPSGEARELGVHEGGVRDAALSSDGGEYATLGNDGKIKFWELDSKEEAAYEWDLSPIRISRLAFIPNSRSIAIGDSDHRVGFWNRDTKQKSIDLAPRNAAVRALRVSPDGTMLAVLAGNELTLWRLKEWELTATVSVDGYIVHEGLAFSRDGKSLAGAATRRRRAAVATGPGTESGPGQRPALEPSPAPDILVWNTADGTLRRTLRGHKAPIRSLSFNSDGTRLVSGSDDMTIRVWKTD